MIGKGIVWVDFLQFGPRATRCLDLATRVHVLDEADVHLSEAVRDLRRISLVSFDVDLPADGFLLVTGPNGWPA